MNWFTPRTARLGAVYLAGAVSLTMLMRATNRPQISPSTRACVARDECSSEQARQMEETVDQLQSAMASLHSADPVDRAWGTARLGQLGPSAAMATYSLMALLDDPNIKVRYGAAMALANIGQPAAPAVPALVRSLDDKDSQVRLRAIDALGNIGPAARPALSALTGHAKKRSGNEQAALVIAVQQINLSPTVPASPRDQKQRYRLFAHKRRLMQTTAIASYTNE